MQRRPVPRRPHPNCPSRRAHPVLIAVAKRGGICAAPVSASGPTAAAAAHAPVVLARTSRTGPLALPSCASAAAPACCGARTALLQPTVARCLGGLSAPVPPPTPRPLLRQRLCERCEATQSHGATHGTCELCVHLAHGPAYGCVGCAGRPPIATGLTRPPESPGAASELAVPHAACGVQRQQQEEAARAACAGPLLVVVAAVLAESCLSLCV